ncbi:MAG: diacylglycerol kinase family protein [Anaerolineaceae bacterium]|nr:diacylglycerol kinase family protein [Anaerolineaceae bacterium]
MQKINRLQSFQYAFAGLWYTLKTQRNAQIHVGIGSCIVVLAFILQINLTEWTIIALTSGFVIVTEMLNTAIEDAMDFASTDYHPQIKVVKDVAAGAVLVSAITAVVIGLLILGPKLYLWLYSFTI